MLKPLSGLASLLTLHLCVLRGDSGAAEDLIARLLHPVCRRLRRRLPRIDPALVDDAVEDALIRYLGCPTIYDASRSRLDTYITLGAKCNLIDALRRRQRCLSAEHTAAAIFYDQRESPRTANESRPQMDLFFADTAWTMEERQFFAAKLSGERRTQRLAAILGLEAEAASSQRRGVKRTFDRLRLRLQRDRRHARTMTRVRD